MRIQLGVLNIIKKGILLILGICLAGGIGLFLWNGGLQPDSNNADDDSNTNGKSDSMIYLEDVLENAKQGRIPELPVTTGQTNISDIHQTYGDADKSTSIARGTYLTYTNDNFSVGYGEDGMIFDVRSYSPKLDTIHYNIIKQKLGNPDHVLYYKDDKHDQIILVYDLNEIYQLKFILPKPNDQHSNPTLNHTSVLQIAENEQSEQNDESMTIDEQIKKMSLNEKVGQMIFAGFKGPDFNPQLESLIKHDKVGGIIFYSENMTSPEQTVKLINTIKEANMNNPMPLLFGVDQEGGRISRLPGSLKGIPTNLQIGKQNDADYSYRIGRLLGKEVKAYGFNLDFAPVLDINSNPNNPVIGDRSFGNDPSIVSKLGIQTMKGLQSENVISVIKHFPGHGDTNVDSHLELPKVDKTLEELNEMELIPFKDAIKHNADVVMIAHILLNKIDPKDPASLSKEVITNLLREKMNYKGLVITDDMTMDAIEKHYDLSSASVKSVQAGSDIIMVAHNDQKVAAVHDAILKAVKNGTISEQRINESVKRIINTKKKYEIDDHNQIPFVNVKKLNEEIDEVIK